MRMTPWVTRLIAANVVMYFLQHTASGITNGLALVPALIIMRPWTIVTYMFLHGGIWHILFNMIVLFFFGPRLEERLGSTHFLVLYFVSGITGGLASILLAPLTPIIGASAALYGLTLAYAKFWPHDRIYIWGVLPIEARWLVVIFVLFDLFGISGLGAGNIAHFAHLGGFVGGLLFLWWLSWRSPARRFKRQVVAAAPRPDPQKWKAIDRSKVHELNREELDRILDKINAQGIESLTASERSFLDHFSSG